MAKVEEIAELLTEEIYGFNQSIERLQKLSEHLGDIKVKADATEVESLLKQHLKEHREIQSFHNDKLTNLYKEMKGAYLFPRWLVISMYIMLVLTLLSWGLVFYFNSKKNTSERKFENAVRHYRTFMKETPEAKALYENWLNEEK